MPRENSKTIGNSLEQTRQYHMLYLRAISNSLRRKILKALQDGCSTIGDLKSATGLDTDTLKWHLSILEHGFCIEKHISKGKLVFEITKEGRVIDHLE